MMSAKRFISLFIIFMLILAPCFPCTASAGEDTGVTLKVAYSDNSSYIIQNSNGSFYGYGVDYLNEISRFTNWNYEYVNCSFEQSLEMLENGDIDLVCCVQRTASREKQFLFAKYASGYEFSSLYVSTQNDNIQYEDFPAFNGMKIGFLNGFQSNATFAEYAHEHNFNYIPYYYKTTTEMDNAFYRGEIDAFTRNSLRTSPNQKVIARYAVDPFYIVTNKKATGLLKQLNDAQLNLKLENPYFEDNLHTKHFHDLEVSNAFFTMEEQFYIRYTPPLKVAYHKNLYPMTYLKNNKMEGIVAEFFNEISKISNLSFRFIPYDTYYDCINAISNGEADILANVEVNSFWGQDIQVTAPYFSAPLMMLTAKDAAPPLGNTTFIAVHNITPAVKNYLNKSCSNYKIIKCHSPEDAVNAVLSGQADCSLESSYYVTNLLTEKAYKNLQSVSLNGFSADVKMGLPLDSDALLLSVLNKSIQSISSTERVQLISHAMAQPNTKASLWSLVEQHRILLAVVLSLFLLFLLLRYRIQKHKQQKILEKIAYYDELTGLRTRAKFCIDMQKLLNSDNAPSYAVVNFDIDRFPYLNTVLSQEQCNSFLQILAQLITESLEADEINGRLRTNDFVALYHYESNTQLVERIEKIAQQFTEEMKRRNVYYKIFIHAGIELLYDNKTSPAEALSRAILANNACVPGNIITFFDNRLKSKLDMEMNIESNMDNALKNGEFIPFLQPKYNIDGTGIVGAEALVRWKKPGGILIYPGDFIPLFEKNGFIISLDYCIYEQILKWMQSQLAQKREVVRISVNLSRLHANDTYLQQHLTEMADRYGIPHHLIEFELTESAFSDENANLFAQLKALRDQGFFISIDDFGAGYSSLNLLRHVPADLLKIDKEFLHESNDSARSSLIIRDILIMAKDIHMQVICEGVETKEQLDFLKEIHCDYIQGYYFAKPMPCHEFESLLAANRQKQLS